MDKLIWSLVFLLGLLAVSFALSGFAGLLITLIGIVVCIILYFSSTAIISMAGEAGFFIKTPKPGHIMVAMKGGLPDKLVYSVKGWRYNEATDTMEEGERTDLSRFERHFGVQWIGNPFRVKVYSFRLSWDEFSKESGSVGQEVVPHVNEPVNSLYFQYLYALIVKEAETAGNIPLNLEIEVMVRRIHPLKSMFDLGTPLKGLETVLGLAMNEVRQVVQTLDIDEVLGLGVGEKKKDPMVSKAVQDKLSSSIVKLNTEVDAGSNEEEKTLPELTGYQIVRVAIQTVKAVVTEKEEEILRAEVFADKRAAALIIEAKAAKEVAKLHGEGEEAAIRAVARVMAQTKYGSLVRKLTALEKSRLLALGKDQINIFADENSGGE